LKIMPGEPSVLSNLGLSYMLSRDLPKAEEVLRQAYADPKADARVRQNLGLVVGLQGRFAEAEQLYSQALTGLRAQRDLAEERLEERIVRAPHAGVVSDVRIRAGEALNLGETVLSLVGEQTRFSLVAMLPGHYRPMLRPGMLIRLELAGFKYVYQTFAIDGVSNEVVGPGEVRRFLGQELADTVVLKDPVVLVTARLPNSTFIADGKTFNFYEGMQGNTDAKVRAESVLITLIPGLKALFNNGG